MRNTIPKMKNSLQDSRILSRIKERISSRRKSKLEDRSVETMHCEKQTEKSMRKKWIKLQSNVGHPHMHNESTQKERRLTDRKTFVKQCLTISTI